MFRHGTWGDDDAAVVLAGEEVGAAVPGALLEHRPVVRSRVGIDLNSIDVRDPDGRRLLEAFLVGGGRETLEKLRRAADVVEREPVRLVEGDYVERLPEILDDLPAGGLTVVFSSHALEYLSGVSHRRLTAVVEDAARRRDLCWLTLELPRPLRSRDHYLLELRLGRRLERRVLARELRTAALEWSPPPSPS